LATEFNLMQVHATVWRLRTEIQNC